MAFRNTTKGWGWASRALHWSSAALVTFLLVVGFYKGAWLSLEDPEDILERFRLLQMHKSLGAVAFALVALRLVWRAVSPAPKPSDRLSPVNEWTARATHVTLYVLLLAMPVTGWLHASASPAEDRYGISSHVFGLFTLPDPFVPGSEKLADCFGALHTVFAVMFAGVLALHVGAALWHALVWRDDVLRRMVTG